MKMIRTRFAPSPTGNPHIGSIWLALFNWLWAKKNKGEFILRIEDTDQSRMVPGSVEQIRDSLEWYGLNWDGFYKQSERLAIYKQHVDQLTSSDHAYYCFCDSNRLESLRKQQELAKMPSKYDRHCLALSKSEVAQKLVDRSPYIIRLKIPNGKTILNDIIRGEMIFDNTLIDDQVLLKSDGYPTYHLASVVDDYLMEITHIIRGEEWLSSAPKHIILYNAFGWQMPEIAHLPLIFGEDKTKLSKRHGAVSALEFKKLGYLRDALINFLALLGWNPKTTQEIFSISELIQQFDLEKINKACPIFNTQKLDWFNNYYLRNMPIDDLVTISAPFMTNCDLGQSDNMTLFKKALLLVKERLKRLNELPELLSFFFVEPNYPIELLKWKNITFQDIYNKLLIVSQHLKSMDESNFLVQNLETEIKKLIADQQLGVGETLWPLRVALTGLKESPNPFEVMYAIGKDKTLLRVQKALDLLHKLL